MAAPAPEANSSISASTSTYKPPPLFLLCTATVVIAPISFFLLAHAHARNRNRNKNPKAEAAGRLPPGPPALLFLAKFLALRRSIFDLAPLLRDLHERYGPVISIRLARTLVFVADRRLAHKLLVQGGATFADRPSTPTDSSAPEDATSAPRPTVPIGASCAVTSRPRHSSLPASPCSRPPGGGRATASSTAYGGKATLVPVAVTLRPFLRRAMFELLVYMCFGARLGQDAMDEIEVLQHRMLLSVTTFPIFAFFPAVTKRLFRSRWEAYVTVRRRQEEVFVPLIHATRGNDDDANASPPCYADSLRALRVPEEGDHPLTDAEMVSLCSEFLNGGTDTTVTLVEWIMAELVNHPDVQAKVREEVAMSRSKRCRISRLWCWRACACTRRATSCSRTVCGPTTPFFFLRSCFWITNE